MDFRVVSTEASAWVGDGLAIGLYEADLAADLAAWQSLDLALDGAIHELVEESEFKAKLGSSATIRVGKGRSVKKLILLGLGKAEDLKLDGLRRAAAAAAKAARTEKCQSLGIQLPIVTSAAATAQAIVEGAELVLYKDRRFKSEPEESSLSLSQVELLGLAGAEAAIAQAQSIVSGVNLARQLVAAPANSLTPLTLADIATQISTDHGMTLTILEQADCEALGMGAFLGVALGSDIPPKFIHLVYKPDGTPRKKLAIVGKGLTFDSGGYNIKGVGSGIETMKMDMGGAAATFGAAQAIGKLQPDVEVHFISAVTENMISGKAMHPGDILTASNGKTIEINNTDAEGRLTLADALVFADKLGVDAIVDLATLTGACIIALGDKIGGLWSPDDELAASLKAASETAGEKFWQMPFEASYMEGIKSSIADFKNTGPRPGGSITAALFLKEFVKDTAWAHLDVAGPVWTDKEDGYNPAGATGYGVRTLVNWVLG